MFYLFYWVRVLIKNDLFSNDEAYTVKIGIDKIKITGKTAEGVYRGVKTLEQVLKLNDFNDNSNKLFLPGGEITDQPSYEYRGAMLDVSRHFFSVSDVKRYIDETNHGNFAIYRNSS